MGLRKNYKVKNTRRHLLISRVRDVSGLDENILTKEMFESFCDCHKIKKSIQLVRSGSSEVCGTIFVSSIYGLVYHICDKIISDKSLYDYDVICSLCNERVKNRRIVNAVLNGFRKYYEWSYYVKI